MVSITPCQRIVSDRFPVASFVVQVPPERLFEIACATDPSLFHADQRHRRSPDNFFTTRGGGLLRAPAGQATYLLPPDQLRRFAGKQRLYYNVGSYTNPRGEDPRFHTPPDAPEAAPSIQIAADFTGRTLDRSRLGKQPADARYGGTPGGLTWGGDLAASRAAAPPASAALTYDDGYPAELWSRREEPAPAFGGAEPPGYEDARTFAPRAPAEPRSATPPGHGRAAKEAQDRHHEAYPSARDIEDARVDRAPTPVYGEAARVGRAPTPVYGEAARGEPPGFEDAPALARAGRTPVAARYGDAGAEPPGFEDAPALARAGRAQAAPRYGDAGGRYGDGPVTAPPAMPGRDEAYAEDMPAESELPADLPDAPVRAVAAPRPLTIPEKFKIVMVVAGAESGADLYAALNPDGEYDDPRHPAYQRWHVGLSWGLVQFTQRSGALGRVLDACRRRDEARFRAVFGDAAEELCAVTDAATEEERLRPVGGALLWQEPWLSRFREAGRVPAFQAAQNEVSIEGYLDPNLLIAAWLGFNTDRALAMLYDRCIHMGNGGGPSFVVRAVGPIRSQRQRAAALAALGKADLRAFQADTPGLEADGAWNAPTHAALCAALRALGDRSPVEVPTLSQMLDRLVEASRGRRFEARVRALRESGDLHDTPYQVV